MNTAFIIANEGIPINVLLSKDYPAWLKKQSEATQNWLKSCRFEGKGHHIIPETNGNIGSVIYCLEEEFDFFIAGDLPTLLPAGQYKLNELPHSFSDAEKTKFSDEFIITWGLASYRFERYKKSEKALAVLAVNKASQITAAEKFINAISLVRDMINCPAGDLMPEHISEIVDQLAETYTGASVSHIIGDDLLTQNYPTIHAVGRASAHAPRLIDLTWGDPSAPKITLVGKGVCFDSGGLDLKPASAMRNMKKDMGGSAHVLGLASLIMAHNLPVRLRVLIPAVENAVSANAFRPGDIITTRKGTTVEIDNTDAEGRLVLCDALTEADSETPELIVDFATLTGACRVALGTELPGFFCNHSNLAHELAESSEQVKDPIWQLPLFKPYQAMLASQIADTQNSSNTPYGGAITAALYLQLFVAPTTPWVHFDVMAWNIRKLPGRPEGGEAFGIRAVFHYLQQKYAN